MRKSVMLRPCWSETSQRHPDDSPRRPERTGLILGLGVDQRQEAVGIDRRDVVAVERLAEEARAFAVAKVDVAEQVEFGRADRMVAVDPQLVVHRAGITIAVAEAVDGLFARVEDAGADELYWRRGSAPVRLVGLRSCHSAATLIWPSGPIGMATTPGERDRAAVAQLALIAGVVERQDAVRGQDGRYRPHWSGRRYRVSTP